MGLYSRPFTAQPKVVEAVFQRWSFKAHEGIIHDYRCAKDNVECHVLTTEVLPALVKQYPDACLHTAEWLRTQTILTHPPQTK